MKTDTYTKVVLTVIAVFLLIIVVRDINPVRKAYAEIDRNDIAFCWDGATILKVHEKKWKIKLDCQYKSTYKIP